jgi:hypothetical protein
MTHAASIETTARDFHAVSITSATILSDAICAVNALSLHLHGALGPGFDRDNVCECVGVEDVLSQPMKRSLTFRRLISPFLFLFLAASLD